MRTPTSCSVEPQTRSAPAESALFSSNVGQHGFAEPIIERKMGGGGVAEAELHFDGVSIESDAVLIVPDAESKTAVQKSS